MIDVTGMVCLSGGMKSASDHAGLDDRLGEAPE